MDLCKPDQRKEPEVQCQRFEQDRGDSVDLQEPFKRQSYPVQRHSPKQDVRGYVELPERG